MGKHGRPLNWTMGQSALLMALFAAGGCGSDSMPPFLDQDASIHPDAMTDTYVPPINIPNPVFTQTTAPDEVRAGDEILVECIILDEDGAPFSAVGRTPVIRFSPADAVAIEDGSYIAIRAGSVEVSCSFPDLMLTDDDPAIVRIVPGPAAEVSTELDAVRVEAGNDVNATCTVMDAYGNLIEDAAPSLRVEPSDPGNTTEDLRATMTRSGVYDVSCALDGAAAGGQRLEVVPTLPANLIVGKEPDQPVYAIGQVVVIATQVTDRYDNLIPTAPLSFTSDPVGSTLGANRFRYDADGVYNVTAQVTGPTQDDATLEGQVQIVVNGDGPQIQCDGPAEGAMVDLPGSGRLTFRGSVADPSGVDTVLVNGAAVAVDASGAFSQELAVDFGINFVEIVARDSFGEESSRTCAFLASRRWGDPASTLPETLTLQLAQAAIDDMDSAGPIDSLNDILMRVINSTGMVTALDGALEDANPLKEESCDQRVLSVCVFRSGVDYVPASAGGGVRFDGPRTTQLTLIDGGVRARVRFEDIRVRLDIDGTFNRTGWAKFDHLEVQMDLATSISAGRPRMTVIPASVTASSGTIRAEFSGLGGAIVGILTRLFNSRLRSLVEDQLKSFISSNFNDVLDGVFGGLDVDSLGSTFQVGRLDGSGDITLSFGAAFNSLNTNSARMRFGIGTRFTGPTSVAFSTRGVAVMGPAAGSLVDSPSSVSSMSVSVHAAMLNQAMHALWRGGLLAADIGASDLGGGLPSGLSAQLSGALPPVAHMTGDGMALDIGALTIQLVYPGLFDTPITLVLGAEASTSVSLVGNDLQFGDVTIDALHFSTADASLDASTRATLNRFLTSLVQSIVDSALNDSLPAIPVPAFDLPASLTTFGIPAGTTLGLRSPSLSNEDPHFVLRGTFGSL